MNNEVKKVLFIVNKFSGLGYRKDLEGTILRACEIHNIECVIEFTQARGHATELARNAVADKTFDLVVAVGGDGTVNEVARGLLGSKVPMGILPKGSGNGLARHLGIPMKLRLAMEVLFNSQLISMDAFTLNDRLSLNVSGIGFDGHIANLFGDGKKRGLQGYAKLAVNEFFSFKEFEVKITKEDTTITRHAFIIAVANSSQYGNNARIAPAASVKDGKLHLCLLKKVPAYRVDFLFSFFRGTLKENAYCEFIEIENAKLQIDKPVAFHVDGEPTGEAATFDVKIVPGTLSMFVPRASLKI